MLQQTQVTTVIPYYQRFIHAFPDIAVLANATLDDVLALWSGLGYYARGRNLLRAAHIIMSRHNGVFPGNAAAIEQLPGIGRSTAAAIAAFAFGERCTILDGNVKRILVRYFGIHEHLADKAVEARLWQLAESLLPANDHVTSMATYTQALMDLGALVCTRSQPKCERCPLQAECIAFTHGLTGQLPTPKPRKNRPEKSIIHLLLVKDSRVFLEKRPSSGIWGGLWCFPEIPFDLDSNHGCAVDSISHNQPHTELPCIVHTFTHFRLTIYPRLIVIGHARINNEKSRHCWITASAALQLATPAPVRKLLLTLTNML